MKRLILCALILPGWAFAQQAGHQAPMTTAELYPQMPGVEYYCTNSDGFRVELGNVICITASCVTWMARCEMSANNNLAMWRKVQDGCPAVSVIDRIRRLDPQT